MSASVELKLSGPPDPPEEEVMQWENGQIVYHSEISTEEWVMAEEEDLISLEDMR